MGGVDGAEAVLGEVFDSFIKSPLANHADSSFPNDGNGIILPLGTNFTGVFTGVGEILIALISIPHEPVEARRRAAGALVIIDLMAG